MNNLRRISQKLISAFKKEKALYDLVKENNPQELLACIRNNAIGIYYNADKVAMVSLNSKGDLTCRINSYYLSNYYATGGKRIAGKEIYVSPQTIVDSFETIKKNSNVKFKSTSDEKKAQQNLCFRNNSNPSSGWVCIDIEYRQSTKVQKDSPEPFTGRFDIIAVSKAAPHRVAIIELKYNDKAFGGDSGVVKHISDFLNFNASRNCAANLRKEIREMLDNLNELGLLQQNLRIENTPNAYSDEFEYYIISLYDNAESTKGKMGAYLFNSKRHGWNTKQVSSRNAERVLKFDAEDPNAKIRLKCLFKKVKSSTNVEINDILDENNYEK